MGLHLVRDRNLPYARGQLMKAIEEDLLSDDGILAVFYGGSIGVGNPDLYSDIDLRIVVSEKNYSRFIDQKVKRAKSWGDVLFFEQEAPRLRYTVVHYLSFVKMDCFYYRMTELYPSVWLQDIRIIKDTTGKMKELQQDSKQLNYEPTIEEVVGWRRKLYAYFHEAYRRIMRGEISYVHSMILGLKWMIAAGWLMEKGIQPNAFGDWSKIEGERSLLSHEKLEQLQNWNLPSDEEALLHVLKKMVPAAKETNGNLSVKIGISPDMERFEQVMGQIL